MREEEILDPALPIVDAHHHLWDRPGARYLLDDLLRDTGSGHDLRATVYVQARSMLRAEGPEEHRSLGETEFANGIAAASASGLYGPVRACAAIVGMVDLMLGDGVVPVLERHLRAAGARFRGVRNQTAWHASPEISSNPVPPRPGLLSEPAFRGGAARLAEHGLSLDVWAYHTQLGEVLDLARALPGLTLVLDHCGGPLGAGLYAGQRAEVLADWGGRMRLLAGCPNVVVKLGGLGMAVGGFGFEKGALPPSSEELAAAWHPYLDTCVDAFGAARCMFESNFPVDKGSTGYAVLWNAFKRFAAPASPGERTHLFAGTAIRTYRLPPLTAG
ncbi:amidohydrolase family protein [Muricoccus pecuniae]|uniref:Putative TIM-barrel fold metal-dependent hydrolase n=1 Tax=Muricoccus pecuniae TaxID=693023 RepID=A0A840YI66_9PROT|nr:amidohydrolase family protein [Roseomonas pecuniae]MBB5696161.1 putative TIM-barrel fold metal-dependent hydrolase [Roseomonas pecuniae]